LTGIRYLQPQRLDIPLRAFKVALLASRASPRALPGLRQLSLQTLDLDTIGLMDLVHACEQKGFQASEYPAEMLLEADGEGVERVPELVEVREGLRFEALRDGRRRGVRGQCAFLWT
jgi:hypothetical protein